MRGQQYYFSVDLQTAGYPVGYITPTSKKIDVWCADCNDPSNSIQEFKIAHQGHEWQYASYGQLREIMARRQKDLDRLAEWNRLSQREPAGQIVTQELTEGQADTPSRSTLYTFGYLASSSGTVITRLILEKTPVIDIRFNPTSRNPAWRQTAIAARPGIIYEHIPALGNEWYQAARKSTESHIKIADIDSGLARLGDVLNEHGRAAIFCACNNKKCHRFEVANQAAASLDIQVIHL